MNSLSKFLLFTLQVVLLAEYAGLLVGVGNTIASAATWIGPKVAGRMLEEDASAAGWSSLMLTFAATTLPGLAIYLSLCSVDSLDANKKNE